MIAVLLSCILSCPAIALGSAVQVPVDSADTSTRWLLSYKRQGEGIEFIQKNARLRALMKAGLLHYGVPWYREGHTDLPLPEGAFHAISLPPSLVTVAANRFVTITGSIPGAASFQGLLWCDTAAEQPTLIFVFVMGAPGPSGKLIGSLDVYTNRNETDSPLPPQLIKSIHTWLKESKIGAIGKATVHDAQDETASLTTSDLTPQ